MKKVMFMLAVVSTLAMPLMAGEACCPKSKKAEKKAASTNVVSKVCCATATTACTAAKTTCTAAKTACTAAKTAEAAK